MAARSPPGDGIEIRNVTKVFGRGNDAFTALSQVCATIERNEFFTLLGPSGCGKTTLLRLIAGFDEPTSGQILLAGEDIAHLPPYRRPVNTVFQSYALFPHMSVAQNIAFGLEMLGRPRGEVEDSVDAMLRLVKMESLQHRRTAQISGGQQQRVALARALAPRPKVLLLDEPLSALDLKLRKEMQIELKRLQTETGITFVFVTHDQEEALTMSDRVAVMNQGAILQIGTPREIYDHPSHRFVADFIGDINFLDAKVAVGARGELAAEVPGVGFLEAAQIDGRPPGEPLTLAIRPERIDLGESGEHAFPGILDNVVYHGTDTIFHFSLPGGERMRARIQNRDGTSLRWTRGQSIGWSVRRDSVAIVTEDPR